MADYGSSDIIKAILNGNSTSIWGISPPSKEALIQDLNGTGMMTIKFQWDFYRCVLSRSADKLKY